GGCCSTRSTGSRTRRSRARRQRRSRRRCSSVAVAPWTEPNLLLALEQRSPESARLGRRIVGVVLREDLQRRLGLGGRLAPGGWRAQAAAADPPAGLDLERELGLLELGRVLLAEQLAHELAQLLRVEAIARDQRVEIGGEVGRALVPIGNVPCERLEADRI